MDRELYIDEVADTEEAYEYMAEKEMDKRLAIIARNNKTQNNVFDLHR